MKIINFKKLLFLSTIIILFLSCTTTVAHLVSNEIYNDIQYYSYNDLDIKFTDHGKGNTILFIHGLGSSSFTWRHLYNYYSLEYRVISIDLKGFGNSSKPRNQDYSIQDQSRLVQQFIKDKDLTNITIVGNSYGGTVALSTYTSANKNISDRVSSLILIDPAAYQKEQLPGYIVLLQTPFLNKVALLLGPKSMIASIILKQVFYNDSLITSEMVSTYANFLRGSNSHNALIESARLGSSNDTVELESSYNNINIPVLIIWGEEDNVIKMDVGEQLNKDIPQSELVIIKDCGHAPQEELPKITINTINHFFNTIF